MTDGRFPKPPILEEAEHILSLEATNGQSTESTAETAVVDLVHTKLPRRASSDTEQGQEEPSESDEKPDEAEQPQQKTVKPAQASTLIELANEVELFHDPDWTAYATFTVKGHDETWAVRSKGFRTWLRHQYFLKEKKTPSTQALQDAIDTLEGKAQFQGLEYTVHLRIAGHGGCIYLDLGDADWCVVEISRGSWRVLDRSPVRFHRQPGQQALPVPVPGTSLNELKKFVNCTEDEWPLALAWLVGAFRPSGPYVVLSVNGEHGSAKSTTCYVLRRLIDPNKADLGGTPREDRDLMIAANNAWIVAFDNLSHIQPALSDSLARLATGTGWRIRKLYSDDEEMIFKACRPIMLNAIEQVVVRPDLGDRTIIITPEPIKAEKRRTLQEFNDRFEEAQPGLLGALLDVVAYALGHVDQVEIKRLPRMADFAKWAVAACPAMGVKPADFLEAYKSNRQKTQQATIEASPFAQALVRFINERDEHTFEGPAGELLDLVGGEDERKRFAKQWPNNAHKVGGILQRLAPTLRAAGWIVERKDKARPRAWLLTGTGGDTNVGNDEMTEPGSDQEKRSDITPTIDDEQNVGENTPPDLHKRHPDIPDILIPTFSGSVEEAADERDELRETVAQVAQGLSYPRVKSGAVHTVLPGEENWTKFLRNADGTHLAAAFEALKGLDHGA